MSYAIWCRVSGGVTGTRESWMKDGPNGVMLFDSLEKAAAHAKKIEDARNSNPYRTADFSYTPKPYD